MNNLKYWKLDQIDKLRLMWAAGVAAPKIALEIGVTEAAVHRKRHRLKLPIRRGSVRDVTKRQLPPQIKPLVVKVISSGIMANLLNRTGCCAPVGRLNDEHMFCNKSGRKVRGSIWCDEHFEMYFADRHRVR